MYEIKVEITGIAPLAVDPLTAEMMDTISKGTTGGRKSVKQQEIEGAANWYHNDKGYACIPKRNIKKCLLEGIQKAGLKYGRGSLVPYAKATIFVKESDASLGVTKPDFVEKFPVKKLDGKTIVKVRAGFNTGWKISFTFVVVDERRDADQLKVAFEEAGFIVGLGNGRPEYGRFEVTGWEVIKRAKE